MKALTLILVLCGALFAVTCSQQSSLTPAPSSVAAAGSGAAAAQGGALPLTASIEFGRDDVGSPFPPPLGHDGSGHAMDKLFPRTVVIGVGGTVTFTTFGVHEIALYKPGTLPEDINTSLVDPPSPPPCPPVPYINDPHNRIAVLGDAPCEHGPTTVQHRFTQAGKYLVICNFLPHFVDSNMYGWVEVKDNN
jgi:plastocyanin